MSFPVYLDACCLVPINLTDVLLRLAEAHTYRPLWSDQVLEEVERNLPRIGSMTAVKARRRVEVMRSRFSDALVTDYESLVPSMTNDSKDRHVLAAAVRSGAAAIVTANTKDFPPESTEPYDIDVVTPDEFLLDQLDLHPGPTLRCLNELVADRRCPPEDLFSFLVKLTKTTPDFCAAVQHRLGV
ncbi:Predicted nucleic acid-binding protein, contains PIN domain [Actinopolyspora mzabensis]|uniref:Predicted nucleic acid-binding protein, contains PIN domain n=1 Tax=Actinopolyspora mzabensis TaxID=995066 RepID=A0A1G9C757_ACTMZ|nr:PIN domain-containing protein [Actinopolyspora mzabensis]SDK47490.1 Predicted nucleic acid-binding protein, contains PIN domain [Actinopolyspora mzabensis]